MYITPQEAGGSCVLVSRFIAAVDGKWHYDGHLECVPRSADRYTVFRSTSADQAGTDPGFYRCFLSCPGLWYANGAGQSTGGYDRVS